MNGREPFPTNKTGCAHLIRNWCRYPDPHNLQIAWPAHFNLFPSLQHESSTTDARTATSYGFGCDPVARQIELWHQGECPLSSHTQLQAVTPAVVNWCSWFWIPVALVDGFKGFAQIGITVYIYIHTLCIYIYTHIMCIYIYYGKPEMQNQWHLHRLHTRGIAKNKNATSELAESKTGSPMTIYSNDSEHKTVIWKHHHQDCLIIAQPNQYENLLGWFKICHFSGQSHTSMVHCLNWLVKYDMG